MMWVRIWSCFIESKSCARGPDVSMAITTLVTMADYITSEEAPANCWAAAAAPSETNIGSDLSFKTVAGNMKLP
jgi:hypothetical protein